MIGSKLGPYELLEELGRGGMATVYRAHQPNVDRFVAVKVIHAAIALDSKLLDRFTREARLVAKLEHPHILPVYDYNGQNDPPYIVMRYLPTGTLKDILEHEQLPHHEVSYLLGQIGAALDYAHRQGVIHRDIKPSNIMVDADGNGFLTDFGIARMVESSEGLTGTGMAIGTPGYMAPEQGLGAPIDGRADIYALGVMLFEMLTGRVPFKAETPMAVILKHINDPVPEVTAANPKLPPALNRVIQKAMAKKPEERYQTAAELTRALNAALGPAPESVPQVLQSAATQTINALAESRKRKSQTVIQDPLPGGIQQPKPSTEPSAVFRTSQPKPITATIDRNTAQGAAFGAGAVLILALIVGGIFLFLSTKNSNDAAATAQALALAGSATQTTPAPSVTGLANPATLSGGTSVTNPTAQPTTNIPTQVVVAASPSATIRPTDTSGPVKPTTAAPTAVAQVVNTETATPKPPTSTFTKTPNRGQTQAANRQDTQTAQAIASFTITPNVETLVARVIIQGNTQTAQAIASFTKTPTPTLTPTPSITPTFTDVPATATFTETPVPPPTDVPPVVPPTAIPGGTAVAAADTRLPYINEFESSSALNGWDYDPNSWKLQADSGNVSLIGQGGETTPIVVHPQAASVWEDPEAKIMLISLRMNVDTTSSIGRLAFRFTQDGGYYLFEMSPGFISLKRGLPNNLPSRSKERPLSQARVPIDAGTWHDVLIWTETSRTFVYLDHRLYLTYEDQGDELPGGTILLQSINAKQRVRFDNIKIQLPMIPSQHFEGSDWPNTWNRTSVSTASIANDGRGNNFISVTSGDISPVIDPPIGELFMSCRILSNQGGLQVRVAESAAGAYLFDFKEGHMTLYQLGADGAEIQKWSFLNFYGHGNFLTFNVELLPNEIRVYDGKNVFSQQIKNAPPAGGIRFSAGPGDLFGVDDCLFTETSKLITADANWAFDKITTIEKRRYATLLTDWVDRFDEKFRTRDWWEGGINAPGEFIYDKNDKTHPYYITMTYAEGASWRFFRNISGFLVFGAGQNKLTFFDSSDIYLRVNVRVKSGTAWIANRTTVSAGRGNVNGYRLELTKNADGTYSAVARSYALTAPTIYWEGTIPAQPDGSIPEWITLLVITYHDKVAFFANGRLIVAVNNATILDGSAAIGVNADSTADFNDFQLRDVSPETR